MRLKQLKIVGFKSFADRVSLDFDASIIGIVGPNGCGKSNIVDAFRWVMGEQSAKSLRGAKMQDVLFAGTQKRKPLNFAEVSVTLTDIGDALPIEYDEITLTRRLHRSGESEYFINRQPVRLKDMHHLLLGTGLGKSMFSVFEQGKLDQIIHLSPINRRAIFDEAAGIGRFLQRKKEALRKLEQVATNYDRIQDIHREVEKRARTLKRQSAQAKSYQEKKEQLELLEKGLLITRWEALENKRAGHTERHHELKQACAQENEALEALEEAHGSLKKELDYLEQEAKILQERAYQAKSDFQIASAHHTRLKEEILHGKKEEHKLSEEIELLHTKAISPEDAKEREELHRLQPTRDAHHTLMAEMRAHVAALENQTQRMRSAQKEAHHAYLVAMQEEASLKTRMGAFRFKVDTHAQRLAQMKKAYKEKSAALKSAEKEVATKRKGVETLSNHIDACKEEISLKEKEISSLMQTIADKEETFKEVERESIEISGRFKTLLHLQKTHEGFASGAKRLLEEAENPKSAFYQKLTPLFSHIHPKKESETLISAALHPYAQTLVVETEKELSEVLDFAQSASLEGFSLFCLQDLDSHEASSLANHFLSPITTAEGGFVDHNKVRFFPPHSAQETNPFCRSIELKTLEEKLECLAAEKQHLDTSLKELYAEQNAWETKQSRLHDKLREVEMTLVQENFQLQQLITQANLEKREITALEKEIQSTESQEKNLSESFEELSLQHKRATREIQETQKESQQHESSLEALLQQLHEAHAKREKEEEALRSIQEAWQTLSQSVAVKSAVLEESKQQLKEKKTRLEALSERGLSQKKELESLETSLQTLEKSLHEHTLHAEKAQQSVAQIKEQLMHQEEKCTKKRSSYAALENDAHSLELALTEENTLQKQLSNELQQRFSLTLNKARSFLLSEDHDLETVEKQALSLRSEIEKTRAVNLTSIEEAQEVEERSSDLATQLSDLDSAKNDLETIISHLDKECRTLFQETFEQIRGHFKRHFEILFEGGEADLTFTDSSDPLTAGIEISAKPPGKKMRSITLLSGGERCLTALALLFALFAVRPAPFCILDEVDAPLDDSNIDRFTRVLKTFTHQTQFIIVTHNKKTMSIADTLFGISMEEKGISKLLSLTFSQKKEPLLT